jgi:small subunit ribosomal protein S3Ae
VAVLDRGSRRWSVPSPCPFQLQPDVPLPDSLSLPIFALTVKTTDGYLVRLFAIGFTKKRQGQIKKTTYAQSAQIRQIRQRMIEIMSREAAAGDLKELVQKFVPEAMGREIEKASRGIYPLANVLVRKCKSTFIFLSLLCFRTQRTELTSLFLAFLSLAPVLKAPKYDPSKLLEAHSIGEDETGKKIAAGEFKEPEILNSV